MSERSGKMGVSAGLLILVALVATCAAQSATSAPASNPPASSEPPFSLAIHPVLDLVKAGSPVKIRMTVTNNTKRPIITETWGPNLIFQFDVRDTKGERPLSTRGRALFGVKEPGLGNARVDFPGGSSSGEVVEPGKTVEIEQVVPDLFDLNQPGKYTVQARRSDGTLNGVVKSNTVTVTIVP